MENLFFTGVFTVPLISALIFLLKILIKYKVNILVFLHTSFYEDFKILIITRQIAQIA